MKLFRNLLLAPATLGFLTPISAMASEINLVDIFDYSSSKQVKSIREFDSSEKLAEKIKNVDTLESKYKAFEAGAFSQTTTLSGTASFQLGAVDQSSITEAVTFNYSYEIDLNSSFTGDDNLYVGIDTGNDSESIDFALDASVAGANELAVTSMYYQFPLGEFDVAVGPLLDVDDLIPTTTSKYSDSFFMGYRALLSSNYYVTQGTGAGLAIARTFDNGFNASASFVGTGAGTSGLMTDEGIDMLTLSLGYDGENYGGGIVFAKSDSSCTLFDDFVVNACNDLGVGALIDEGYSAFSIGGYWDLDDDKTTISATINKLDPDISGIDIDKLTDFQIGIDRKLGSGTLSASWKTIPFFIVPDLNEDKINQDDLGSYVELFYTYDVNDSFSLKPGISMALPAHDADDNPNDDLSFYLFDLTAIGVEATFKF